MKIKPFDHSDLMARINATDNVPPKLIRDFGDPGQKLKDADRRAGHTRMEFRVSINRLIDFFRRKKEV